MPALPSSRTALRLACIGVGALVLGAAAYELPPRAELEAKQNPAELVGTYEDVSFWPRNPTNARRFVQLLADGRMRYHTVHLAAADSEFSADVRHLPPRDMRWSLRHASGRGPVAALFARPQLCTRTPKRDYCTPFERDAYTGNIVLREEPVVVRREVVGRLVRLRSGAMPH